ncbi:MAG: PEGA domain-containing protein [Sulfobacillus sp.]
MGDILAVFASGVVLLQTLIAAALITFAAVRGFRNKYVGAASLVVEKFSINSAAAGEPAIHIIARHKGIIAWIMTNLGLETRVEVTVTDKDWALREGSLAGMSVITVPFKNLTATICGYQRSLLAFFLAVFFSLNGVLTLLAIFPILLGAATENTEAGWEAAAKGLAADLYITLGWLVACGIAGIIYYLSKRIKFGVVSEGKYGIVFKRSFIGNAVVDLATAEQATALLNQLVAADLHDTPLALVPALSAPVPPASGSRRSLVWGIAATYVGLFLLAFVLSWYGAGVTVHLTTVPTGATVWLDSQYAGTTSKDAGLILFHHTTREKHTLQFQYPGYEPLTEPIYLGKFESSHSVVVKLTLLNYPVTVVTTPGNSHVMVDGKDVGTSNDAGYLVVPNVDRGVHDISVSHDGYRTTTNNINVFERRTVHIELLSEADAARQEAQAQQQQIAGHLEQGRALFRQAQYQQALDECNSVLKLDPANAAALTLKKQIEQTRKILGQ